MTLLSILRIGAVVAAAAGLAAPLVDECPRAVLTCEKSPASEREYACSAAANQSPRGDAPRYSWALSGGKIVGDAEGPNVVINARGVTSDSLTVTLAVRWAGAPPACETFETKKSFKLR